MSNAEQALSRFKEGALCSQAIFSTYAEKLGLDSETAMKISMPLGAGIARMGETCGAVTGALMAIGLKYGYVSDWRVGGEQYENTFRVADEFIERFKSRNGSTRCREILGCDLSTPEGRLTARKNGLFLTICPKAVQDSGEILDEML